LRKDGKNLRKVGEKVSKVDKNLRKVSEKVSKVDKKSGKVGKNQDQGGKIVKTEAKCIESMRQLCPKTSMSQFFLRGAHCQLD